MADEIWTCMFVTQDEKGLGVLLHEERMTFDQARELIAKRWPNREVEILVPEDFPPYGMEG